MDVIRRKQENQCTIFSSRSGRNPTTNIVTAPAFIHQLNYLLKRACIKSERKHMKIAKFLWRSRTWNADTAEAEQDSVPITTLWINVKYPEMHLNSKRHGTPAQKHAIDKKKTIPWRKTFHILTSVNQILACSCCKGHTSRTSSPEMVKIEVKSNHESNTLI